ncbi:MULTISPECIES: hypothetical protein [Cryobacterium]|uniref:Uncharacterized protein n=1 Tax=Cryobacterium breve TaxID=1259258 RepID=A0ABY2J168_9MICO|nr:MULTISPECIES: hypothetical protein [Cryobacterium]TFC94093.1 hypothetical protein E3T20_08990 [Cryobacterium sp. TmT3-12]TFC98676.1 hypothetical protein E3O65_07300 [Cryobacterium breve]
MSLADTLVAAVAWTLPGLARQRYREEWLGDVGGARDLELSHWSIVGGALVTAITIDRTNPSVTGITRTNLVVNRMRWAAALLGSAAVLRFGLFIWGRYEMIGLAPLGRGIQVVSIFLATLGLFACVGTLVIAFHSGSRRTGLVLAAGVAAVCALMAVVMVMPFLGILAVPASLGAIIVAVSRTRKPASSRPLSRWSRVLVALPFTALALLIVAAGVLHISVWNPLAKVPGLNLDEIYSAMSAAGESPMSTFLMAWAIFWGAVALTLPILCGSRGIAWFFTYRRIIVVGLLTVGATASFHWFAGFNMGMSLADTFMTGGGDAAISGPAIGVVGQTALVVALLIGLPPHRYEAEMVTAGPR